MFILSLNKIKISIILAISEVFIKTFKFPIKFEKLLENITIYFMKFRL